MLEIAQQCRVLVTLLGHQDLIPSTNMVAYNHL